MTLVSESHQSWQERIIAEHDTTRPFAPENGEPLRFAVGDRVIFSNDYGMRFRAKVSGLYRPPSTTSLYARGYRYTLDKADFWMPVREDQLTPDDEATP